MSLTSLNHTCSINIFEKNVHASRSCSAFLSFLSISPVRGVLSSSSITHSLSQQAFVQRLQGVGTMFSVGMERLVRPGPAFWFPLDPGRSRPERDTVVVQSDTGNPSYGGSVGTSGATFCVFSHVRWVCCHGVLIWVSGGLCGEELSSVWERTATGGQSAKVNLEGHWVWSRAVQRFLPRTI